MQTARTALILVGLSWLAGCSSGDDARGHRMAAVLKGTVHASQEHNVRAGLAPAQVKDGEFGIVTAGRLSPSGDWLVVSDAVAPIIKVVNRSGITTATIQPWPERSATQSPWPVFAASDKGVLILPQDERDAAIYDLGGNAGRALGRLRFLPISATAIDDSTWFAYGPSDNRVEGKAYWVHCLSLNANRAVEWRDAFLDEVDSLSTASANVPAPYVVEGGEVLLEHRQRHGGRVLSVNCGGAASEPRVVPRAIGVSPRDAGQIRQAGTAQFIELPTVHGAAMARFDGSMWLLTADDSPALNLQVLNENAEPRRISLGGLYRILDSRAGVGVLMESTESVPLLYLVSPEAIRSALRDGADSNRLASNR